MKKHEIFETNPDLKQVHMTSDGQAFYNDNDAKAHAKTLKDKSVEVVVNPMQLEVIEDDEEQSLKTDNGTGEENTSIPAKADGSVNVLNSDEPKADEPKADEPKADEPKADEPKADEPKADEPKADEPKADEPKADEPKADEPKAKPKKETPKKGK